MHTLNIQGHTVLKIEFKDFNSNPRGGVRSYEMEDIYGRGGAGRQPNNGGQYGQYNQYNQNQGAQFAQNGNFQNSQNFAQNGGFQNNQFQQQNQHYNQQDFQNQQNNSIYEHLTPQARFENFALVRHHHQQRHENHYF